MTSRVVKFVGMALTIAAAIYVVYQIAITDWASIAPRSGAALAWTTAAAAAAYGLAGGLLAVAWWRLLTLLGKEPAPWRPIVAAYATTQIYKYLPTNVLHFVGRHALIKSYGISHKALLGAAFCEAGALVAAASALALLTSAPTILTHAAATLEFQLERIVLAAALIVPAGAGAAWLLARRLDTQMRQYLVSHGPKLARIPLYYAAFFVVSGGLLWFLARGGLDLTHASLLEAIAVVTIAWIVGFLVPGAPAGIGMREATMILLLEGSLGQAHAVALASLYRVVTIGGDLGFALAGVALQSRSPLQDQGA